MAAYLNRIMTGQIVTRFRDDVKSILKNIPGVMGRSMYTLARQFEDALKDFLHLDDFLKISVSTTWAPLMDTRSSISWTP